MKLRAVVFVSSGKYLSRAPVIWRGHLQNVLGALSDLANSYNKRATRGADPRDPSVCVCVCACVCVMCVCVCVGVRGCTSCGCTVVIL